MLTVYHCQREVATLARGSQPAILHEEDSASPAEIRSVSLDIASHGLQERAPQGWAMLRIYAAYFVRRGQASSAKALEATAGQTMN